MRGFLGFIALLALTHLPASASWPTNIHQDLQIGANPTNWASYCTALPYPEGSTLVVFFQGDQGYSYQIIDRYGELVFNPAAENAPQLPYFYAEEPEVVPDGNGGLLSAGMLADHRVHLMARTPNG